MIPEGPFVCDDAQGAPPTSPFELYNPETTNPNPKPKPGDRRNVFRFCAPDDKPGALRQTRGQTNPGTDGTFSGFAQVTPPPRGSAPVPETSPSSSAGPLGAPPADVPTPFPDASRSSRIPAGGRSACFGGLRRSQVRTPSPPGIHATPRASSAPTTVR